MKRHTFKSKIRYAGLVLAVLAASWTAPPLAATTVNPVTDEALVKSAELIFQGVVVRIDNRMSGYRTTFDAQLPHTFVTFQVERTFKGKHTGQSNLFTLRLMGGPDYRAGRFMTVEGCPDFDIGERVVLFVRRNERSICPIVGWPQGRFRIVDGQLFSDTGREVWLTPGNRVTLGPKRDLPEVRTHHRGGDVYAYKEKGPEISEAPVAQPAMSGTRLSVAGFLGYIARLVNTLHTPTELSQLPAVHSAAVDQPFYVSQPRAVGDSGPQQ